MSRLSVGGFKAKLPQRSNIEDSKRVASVGETTRTVTVSVTSQLNNFEDDVSDIYDEELCSYEDVSETLDTRSPAKISEKESPSQEFNMFEPLEEDVYQDDCIGSVHRQKRPLPADGDSKEDEKRLKASTEFVEQALQCDGSMAPAHITTQTMESSSYSHSASRCEAAYESTIKHSLFESQLEDYTSDAQKKLEDGTITVLEFFKLFNIDFVIHNPRQSVVPGRLLSDTDGTPMDLLKDRHISRPKQLVYEADIQTLTEKVEGLKVRMRDLDKHLKAVNRPLWEEMRYSSEKEIKSFGAKLKERNNFFRKTSKVQSHEMKEVLYSNVVRANLEEQQKLRGTVEEADVMIKSLDDCVAELEAELAAVEEKDSEDKPSLKSLQEGMKKVTETLADNDRQITELEMQKKQNSSKLNRLKAETRNLESHMDMLDTLNEWKLREKKDNCTIYTFLHETMFLQLAYEKSTGNDADGGLEQKITNIAFKLELDDEKSQFHAHLVHKLVSQYIQGESAWVEKYPTRRHVPKLLHDVSLVVSRCRLLGEELRLLKMWGGLRLDILHISCMDTRVHIVFSSLKKCSKFEVVFSVSLANQLCGLSVESFNNIIGSTTIQQIEEIVATFTPAKNLLTKIVKKIHNTLLC
ncbi:outer kinetochore KNL1 complex subunit KNL1 [Leuresthes tenuis]|uniref:outer kinetochore KNL1 complex subunit KNL1 n=1 Tax=Leuresthes tenuis TaxID=355514 RepID=UPI003B500B8D